MKYDKEAILNDAEPVKVCEEIGIPVRQIKGRYQIICPGHEKRLGRPDSNFGSCMLTNRGYYCFACGCAVSLEQMVMEHYENEGNSINREKALKIIADTCGGSEKYILSAEEQEESKPIPVSYEELKEIGLDYGRPSIAGLKIDEAPFKNSKEIYGYGPESLNGRLVKVPKKLYIQDEKNILSIKQIYYADKIVFWKIILSNCETRLNETEITIKKLNEEPWLFNLFDESNDYSIILQQLDLHLQKIKKIKDYAEKEYAWELKKEAKKQ